MKKSLKVFLLSVIITLAAVAAVIFIWLYARGWLVLGGQSGFYQGTTVNGIDVSGMSVEKAQEKFEDMASDYSLKVIFRDSDLTFKSSDIDMKFNQKVNLQTVRDEQNSASRTSAEGLKIEIDDLFIYDKDAVENRLLSCDALDKDNMKAPENAALAYDTDAQRFILQDGDEGTTLDSDTVIQAVEKAIENGESILDVSAEGLYEEAALSSDSTDAQEQLDKANSYTKIKIKYDFRDGKSETIDSSTIIPWLYVNDEGKTAIDTDQVQELISSYADAHNTEEGKVRFTTSSGKEIELSADSGGETIDTNALFDDIMSCLDQGTSGERDVHYKDISDGIGNDFGGNYVEVDLDNQVLYLYKGGKKILTSDIVSGDVSKSHMTPTGVFQIFSMVRNTTLKGPGYASKVSYWMPFSGGVGLHDATWRSSFGGDIYKYNGSHGCINMPYDNAKTVFENVNTGYYVVVYGGVDYVEGQTKENNANYVGKDSSEKKEQKEEKETKETKKSRKKSKKDSETEETKKNKSKKSNKSDNSSSSSKSEVKETKSKQKETQKGAETQKATEPAKQETKAAETPKQETQKAAEATKQETQKATESPKKDENTSEKKSEEKSEEKHEEKSVEDAGDEE